MSTITVQVGHCFVVPLTTHAGTGYDWALTGLPAGLALVDTTSQPAKLAGGPVTASFTFLGLAKGTGKLSFALLRPWEPDHPADTRVIEVVVVDKIEDAARSEAGAETFLPLAAIACEGEHAGKITLKSSTNCLVKYGYYPGHPECVLKYGFPVNTLYGYPPPDSANGYTPTVILYAAQPPHK